jgi:Zn-finger nucleic acid-binding protein
VADTINIIILVSLMGYLMNVLLRSSNKIPDKFLTNIIDNDISSSLLLAYYTKGHELLNIANGEMHGMFYDIYITSRSQLKNEPWASSGTIIYKLELSFNTNAHLIGISNKIKGKMSEIEMYITTNNLEKIDLEGDFPNYFSLYAPNSQKMHARYVFDPAAMAYVVDYCQEFYWEIVNGEIYFVAENSHDSTRVVSSSIDFVKQIEPAIKQEFPDITDKIKQRRRTHKNEKIGLSLTCPVCKSIMQAHQAYQECPKGHGRLLQAATLGNYRGGKLEHPPALQPVIRENFQTLFCPNCHKEMQLVNYADSDVIIDSCTNTQCLYRWLDAGELTKIIGN